MAGWMHWCLTAVVAAIIGAGSALFVVEAGGADSHIEEVVQPSIDQSAKDQSDNTSDVLRALTAALKTRLDRIDQEQVDLWDREYVLGTSYDCSGGADTVSVVTVDIYGSGAAERICVLER
jgi:hypothetical protein